MSEFRVWIKCHPRTIGVLAFGILLYLLILAPSVRGVWAKCWSEAVLAGGVLFIIASAAGIKEVLPSAKGFKFALKKSIWIYLTALPLPIFTFALCFWFKEPIFSDWLSRLIGSILLSILIGLFEEGLFRGIVLNSMLSTMGFTQKGVLKAVIISSLLFGLAHVIPAFFEGTVINELTLLQVVMKTATASVIGMFLAVIYLRNQNLWSIAIIHAINDVLVLILQYLYLGVVNTNYVSGSSGNGAFLLFGYAILFCFYLPMLAFSFREIRKIQTPQLGFFVQPWIPHAVEDEPIVSGLSPEEPH